MVSCIEKLFSGVPGRPSISSSAASPEEISFTIRYVLAGSNPPETVLKATRRLRLAEGIAYHDFLVIAEDWQCEGLSRVLLANAARSYRELGISRIVITANIALGGYVWARFGFKPTSAAWPELRREIEARLDRLPVESGLRADILTALERDGPESIWQIAYLGVMLGTGVDLGRSLLAGTAWEGVLDLRDADAMVIFDAYVFRKHGDEEG